MRVYVALALGRASTKLRVAIVATLLSWILPLYSTFAQVATPPTADQGATQPSRKVLEDWQAAMRLHTPKVGCYQSSYPSKELRKTRCVAAPQGLSIGTRSPAQICGWR